MRRRGTPANRVKAVVQFMIHFYGQNDLVNEALAIAPDKAHFHHTLACLLAALNKGNEALIHTKEYIKNIDVVKNNVDDAIELFVELAATGFAKEALELLTKSSSVTFLEPLAIGLKLYIKEDVKAAAEIMEIARDIVKRINERREREPSFSNKKKYSAKYLLNT